ncbi:DUF3310 domain-containing protein [Limnobacter sp.]|uniref:DUF3310 domain-containing protein n=1 Tax=Limnobacter sp. TaxID=2003368 RepID=UPI00311ED34A
MYKYNEGKLIQELKEYVDQTYGEHYSQNQFQATEFIIDGGHGEGFCIGNIMKYAQRYGKKDGKNRKDIMKVLHYALIALYVHDKQNTPVSTYITPHKPIPGLSIDDAYDTSSRKQKALYMDDTYEEKEESYYADEWNKPIG